MTVGSLFSGIGGFDLGLERAGHEILWQVENDPYCQKVLAKHWPDIPCYGDIHDVGKHNLEKVDMICGGFPCQPVSVAGKRKGQDDDRWLWPEFGRLIRELRPRYVLVENVPGLLIRGMGDVLGDLAKLGYDAEWGCVSAASVGAPHLRKRIFIVAHAQHVRPTSGEHEKRPRSEEGVSEGCSVGAGEVADTQHDGFASSEKRRSTEKTIRQESQRKERTLNTQGASSLSETTGDVADTNHEGLQRERRSVSESLQEDGARQDHKGRDGDNDRDKARKPSLLQEDAEDVADTTGPRSKARRSDAMGTRDRSRRDEGLSQGKGGKEGRHWAVEPDVGRVADGVPSRVDRLKGLGNAIVPQVAEWIGRRVQQMEIKTKTHSVSRNQWSVEV